MAIGSLINTVTSSSLTESVGSLLLAGKGRTIMGLFADVTIEEKHKDELIITEHPTEAGASISDHAYMESPELTMKVGWSESAGKLNGYVGNSFLGGTISLIIVYELLQNLQKSKIPLIVMSGKRLYTNMLIKSLSCTTDKTTEHVLIIDITFKKVIRVMTSETTVLVENQASPEATAGVQSRGAVQPVEVNESLMVQGRDFLGKILGF